MSKEGKQFQSSLRERIGMKDTSPGAAISDAWIETESALADAQAHLEVLGEFAEGDPELETAVSEALSGIADSFQAIAASLESVESSLVEAGLLDPSDTEGFEPDSPEADA